MMQGILAANNEAAQVLIFQRKYNETVELLENAMVQLSDPDNGLEREPNTADQNLYFSPVRMNADYSAEPAINPFAIFDRPFVLRCTGINMKAPFELHATLLYNKALALHLRGLKGASTSERDLGNALHFYRQGLTMIRKNCLQIDPLNNVHLLFLALLNNALHLYAHFQCLDAVSRCRGQLSHLLQAFQKVGLCHPDEVTEVFYMNRIFGGSMNAAAAA